MNIFYGKDGTEIAKVANCHGPLDEPVVRMLRRIVDEVRQEGVEHEVFVEKEIWLTGYRIDLTKPVVRMTNTQDDHYVQNFRSKEEVEEFIQKLRNAAEEAWG
jgi:2,4-dienoyl-CoA reductase-like NADH-dependent reductase (Old Yellow Enzyme family)